MSLNKQQQRVVRLDDSPVLVLAGAGSGKTRVISQKIIHLLHKRGVDPRQIVAVSFTNKAAREMHQRLSQVLDKNVMGLLTVSTFHRFGDRQAGTELPLGRPHPACRQRPDCQ